MTSNLLQKWFPTTKAPVILCAPMFMSVNGTLAAEVTKAGGLGKSTTASCNFKQLPLVV